MHWPHSYSFLRSPDGTLFGWTQQETWRQRSPLIQCRRFTLLEHTAESPRVESGSRGKITSASSQGGPSNKIFRQRPQWQGGGQQRRVGRENRGRLRGHLVPGPWGRAHFVRAANNMELWWANNREKNDVWEVGFLSSGKELGFYSEGSGKPLGGSTRSVVIWFRLLRGNSLVWRKKSCYCSNQEDGWWQPGLTWSYIEWEDRFEICFGWVGCGTWRNEKKQGHSLGSEGQVVPFIVRWHCAYNPY